LEGKNIRPNPLTDKINRRTNENEVVFNIDDLLTEMNTQRNSFKKPETIEYQYLSPKARVQVKEEKMPLLLSNAFLTGMVNPEGLSPRNETTVEHIISEHHNKLTQGGESSPHAITEERKKRTFQKTTVASSLAEQNKRKERMTGFLPMRESKEVFFGTMETQMEAAVGQLKIGKGK